MSQEALFLGSLTKGFGDLTTLIKGINLNNILGRASHAPIPVAKTKGLTTSGKVLATTAVGGGVLLTETALLTQTEGGQQLTADVKDTVDKGLEITTQVQDFFSQNPLVLIGLIGLGVLLVIKK